eukprot:4558047-Lingulodinium_polyedra.AAC.1
MRAERGGDPEAPPIWGPEAWRDAVAVFPNRGAFPSMLASALEAVEHIGGQVGVQGGAILLGRLMPDHVDGALEA